jgi:hypothetical protein
MLISITITVRMVMASIAIWMKQLLNNTSIAIWNQLIAKNGSHV